jgi:HD-GYP domain-containing protein (c-di-GMP phosphodiesterase class II)
VRSCHERWDGTGYPDGLAGEEIPLPSRIVFACDAYNAMTTDRPYRAAMPHSDAIAELRANTGTQFDPKIVTALVNVTEQGVLVPLTSTEGVRAVLAGAPVPQSASAAAS